jgi:hypothetical protein
LASLLEARRALLEAKRSLVEEAGARFEEAGARFEEAGGCFDEAGGCFDEAGGCFDEAGGCFDEQRGGLDEQRGGLDEQRGGLDEQAPRMVLPGAESLHLLDERARAGGLVVMLEEQLARRVRARARRRALTSTLPAQCSSLAARFGCDQALSRRSIA